LRRRRPHLPSASGSCTCTSTSSCLRWDSGRCFGGRSDCWTCCGWDSASRRPGLWARDESDLGSRSLPHVALLTLALFSRQPDPLLALLQRGGSGRLPLTLLRDKIGIGRGFFPGPADPLLALAHAVLLALVAFDITLGLILEVCPPHHEEEPDRKSVE